MKYNIGPGSIELARICREISILGDTPHDSLAIREALPQDLYESVRKYQLRLTTPETDPIAKYYENWIWKKLEDISPPPTMSAPANPITLSEGPYWQDFLNQVLKRGIRYRNDQWLYELFSDTEQKYISRATKWVATKLDLEQKFITCSPELEIFHRDLVESLLEVNSTFGLNIFGQSFIRRFWAFVPLALDRYFQFRDSNGIIALTGSRHKTTRTLANKLKQRVDKTLFGLPRGFDVSYETLAHELEKFLESPTPKLIPKRSHPKNPRNILIKELLISWQSAGSIGSHKNLTPIKHILSLVAAVDPDINEREIYREYRLIKNDS